MREADGEIEKTLYVEVKVKLAMLSLINHKSKLRDTISTFQDQKIAYSAFLEQVPSRVRELEDQANIALSTLSKSISERKRRLLTPSTVQQDCSPGPKSSKLKMVPEPFDIIEREDLTPLTEGDHSDGSDFFKLGSGSGILNKDVHSFVDRRLSDNSDETIVTSE